MLLHGQTLQEIKADQAATVQAVVVMVLAAAAIGFGVLPGYDIPLGFVLSWGSWWVVWVFLIYLAAPMLSGSREVQVDWGQVARLAGFAQAPAILMAALSFIGVLGPGVSFAFFSVISLWWFAAMVAAVRHTLSIPSTLRAALIASTFLIPSLLIELAAASASSG